MEISQMGPIMAILAIALDLFALYFIVKSKASAGMKVIWVILVLVIPFVGAIAYFLIYGTGAPPSDRTSHEARGLEEQGFGK